MPSSAQGFNLLEMLVVLAIISILAAMAYPSYTSHLTQSRRSDGQLALFGLAQQMERYFTMNNTYTGATLGEMGVSATSSGGYYHLVIKNHDGSSYELAAEPLGAQAEDSACATLTLNQLGQKGSTGEAPKAECWR